MTIAIIGAGPAGLSAGRILRGAGHAVTVFEKSGGLGGRCATRRTPAGAFDHGAPIAHGLPDDLTGDARIQRWQDGHVAVPGMSTLGHILGEGQDILKRTEITRMTADGAGWTLEDREGTRHGPFGVVLLAIPQPQAIRLLGDSASRFEGLDGVEISAQITGMIAFREPIEPPSGPSKLIGSAFRNGDRPGRDGAETWVVHATERGTEMLLEWEMPKAAALLFSVFATIPPLHCDAHRWRYARTKTPLGTPCLWDDALGIGLCGDWCLGPTVGDAIVSGRALAARVLESTPPAA
ncbi:MAG: NAD(P)/FAD-dependent oxidoreductase [Rubricella sp.]